MDRRSFLLGASSLALAPRLLARLPSSKELALVTADEEARLVAVELASGRVQRYVKTLPKPRSIESVGGMAVVAHSEIGAITIVRGRTLAVAHRGRRCPAPLAAPTQGSDHAAVSRPRR